MFLLVPSGRYINMVDQPINYSISALSYVIVRQTDTSSAMAQLLSVTVDRSRALASLGQPNQTPPPPARGGPAKLINPKRGKRKIEKTNEMRRGLGPAGMLEGKSAESRSHSSVGQSMVLITPGSQVRTLLGPILFFSFLFVLGFLLLGFLSFFGFLAGPALQVPLTTFLFFCSG